MVDVACLGILVADTIAKKVDQLPDKGKLLPVDSISLHTGGCAANTATDLARLGLRASVIGAVGKDSFGDFLLSELGKEGLTVDGLQVKDGVNTSSSVLLVSESGERTILHCYGSNAAFTYEDVDFAFVKEARILFVAGVNLMPSFDGVPCGKVVKKAKELGVYTALDTAWDATGRWMELVEPSLPYLDLFIPSYEEARMIAKKEEPEEIADVFLARGVGLAVIKLGKDGCFIKSKTGEKYTIPTYTDIKAMDTTGAGDSFVAGFLTGILQGWDLEMCGKFANAVGTHCVMELGASTGIKKMDDILEFMKKYE